MSSPAEKEHMRRVVALGCVVCGGNAVPHHIRSLADGAGTSLKVSDYLTIPLCRLHHTDGGYGVAFHAGMVIWEARYGSQQYHLDNVYQELGLEQRETRQ